MATDATGTPTSPDSIPKYNTAVDAPSGKGFNAAMDQLQVALSARASKPTGIVSGETPVWNGTTWVRSSVTNIGPTSLGTGTPSASNFLRGDGTWSASASQKYNTLIDIVSNVTEVDILQTAGYTIPGNTLGANGSTRVTIIGDFLNNTGGAVNLTPRVYFGGTKVWDLGAIAYNASANRTPFTFEVYLANLGATNVQYFTCKIPVLVTAGGMVTGIGGNVTGGGAGEWYGGATNTLTVDTTAGALLRVTAQLGTSSANAELRIRHSMIEFL